MAVFKQRNAKCVKNVRASLSPRNDGNPILHTWILSPHYRWHKDKDATRRKIIAYQSWTLIFLECDFCMIHVSRFLIYKYDVQGASQSVKMAQPLLLSNCVFMEYQYMRDSFQF